MNLLIQDKITIIREYKLTLDELNLLLEVRCGVKEEEEFIKGNNGPLLNWLDSAMNNNAYTDKARIRFALAYNIVERRSNEEIINKKINSQNDSKVGTTKEDREFIKFVFPNEEDDESMKDPEYQLFNEQKSEIESWNEDEWFDKMVKFVETNMPEIFESGFKGKRSDFTIEFDKSIKLFDYFWELNQKSRTCILNAKKKLENEAEKRRADFERMKIDEWSTDFLNWSNNVGLNKYTKSNIKSFFKENGITVLPTTIDIMKEKINNNY